LIGLSKKLKRDSGCPMAAVECMEGLALVRELGRDWHALEARVLFGGSASSTPAHSRSAEGESGVS